MFYATKDFFFWWNWIRGMDEAGGRHGLFIAIDIPRLEEACEVQFLQRVTYIKGWLVLMYTWYTSQET